MDQTLSTTFKKSNTYLVASVTEILVSDFKDLEAVQDEMINVERVF